MIDDCDRVYVQILNVGFIVLRLAIDSGNDDWVRAEVELLHNIPSLLGEKNVARHKYFWEGERAHYIEWMARHGTAEARSRMSTYYQPLWRQLEPFVTQ